MMTIELSTSMPMPRARPPRDNMLRVRLKKYMAMIVMMIDRGIDTATIRVVGRLRRKMYRMTTASTPPSSATCQTLEMASRMKSEELKASTRRMSAGSERLRLSMRSCTRLATCTVLVPDCFCTTRMIAGWRSIRTSVSSSA